MKTEPRAVKRLRKERKGIIQDMRTHEPHATPVTEDDLQRLVEINAILKAADKVL